MRRIAKPTFGLIVLFLAACSYIPFSGGELDGQATDPLTDWTVIADTQIIQLETNPTEPYSVKLWMIAETDKLYVYAGDNHAQWAQNIDANPLIRLKVGDAVYELSATRVVDEAEFQSFAQAWLAKYSSDRTDSNAADTYLYRLSART